MMGTLAWTQRKLIVTTSRTKRSTDFIAHLQALDHLYGPKPGTPIKPVVMVLDNGPIHVSKATRVDGLYPFLEEIPGLRSEGLRQQISRRLMASR